MIDWPAWLPEKPRNRLRRWVARAAGVQRLRASTDSSWLLGESYWESELRALDKACKRGADDAVLRPLMAALPFEIFILLLFADQTRWPNIANRFPSMPPAELQERFTSRSNQCHLPTVSWFVPAVVNRYETGGRRIQDATLLDVGCGWGRFMRAFWWYVPDNRLHGMDVNPYILESCEQCRVPGRRFLADRLAAPEMRRRFSLIYAYSVFTHLAEPTQRDLLARMRDAVTDDGLAALTIRPASYWNLLQIHYPDRADSWIDLKKMHHRTGYAFEPHAEGLTFGETSIGQPYIEKRWDGWQVEGFGFVPDEAYQIVVWLRPV